MTACLCGFTCYRCGEEGHDPTCGGDYGPLALFLDPDGQLIHLRCLEQLVEELEATPTPETSASNPE